MNGFLFFVSLVVMGSCRECLPCYNQVNDKGCSQTQDTLPWHMLHMSVHPHLDAYWIFNFESYYDPKPNESGVWSYFQSNRFTSVKGIFDTARDTLAASKEYREGGGVGERGHRSFFNSEMGFFRRWYTEQGVEKQEVTRALLKTKYWEILGGGVVEHDEGCAYYDDIIENYQMGLQFLERELQYRPKVAISADSFGHSQTTLAILAHLGVEGYLVERSDEHILQKNKTEFIWKAKSANGRYYGALPTHIRWAIHGFEDQFVEAGVPDCRGKEQYANNMRGQNEFLKRILKSTHILRYFGHDFQKFDNYSYTVIQHLMEQFSREKCRRVAAAYGNPTQYFISLAEEVFNTIKPAVTREEDIMPIWDFDSGLYWTGYYTTDPYHKKQYRDMGRLLHAVRKLHLPLLLRSGSQAMAVLVDAMAWQVAYLQHHDGVSGTSKYTVMDSLQQQNRVFIRNISELVIDPSFQESFPAASQTVFRCYVDEPCVIPPNTRSDVYVKVFSADSGLRSEPLVVQLPFGDVDYVPDCSYEVVCLCVERQCPCKLYLQTDWSTYVLIKISKMKQSGKVYYLQQFGVREQYRSNKTHFLFVYKGNEYGIAYKTVEARETRRSYSHLTRYGTYSPRGFSIRSGKYALGNDPATVQDYSRIRRIFVLQSPLMMIFVVGWVRVQFKTLITVYKSSMNQMKIRTIGALPLNSLRDVYLQVSTPIDNKGVFYTDSNGWLVMRRQLYKHQDYQAHFEREDGLDGNSYPVTAFIYVEGEGNKVSVNVDRAEGGTVFQKGRIWLNIDRLTTDDGKWVYENAYRSEYQAFMHYVVVENKGNEERIIQKRYDQVRLVQGVVGGFLESEYVDKDLYLAWDKISNVSRVKLFVRPFVNGNVVVRVHNLHDEESNNVALYCNVSKISPILTNFYSLPVQYGRVQEMTLGANIKYQQFIADKWNWNSIINLTKQNSIFNKNFSQVINLRPLQIRTFLFTGVKVLKDCIQPSQLKADNRGKQYRLDEDKPAPRRIDKKREQRIIEYLLKGDHCLEESPVRNSKPVQGIDMAMRQGVRVAQEFTAVKHEWQIPQKLQRHQKSKSIDSVVGVGDLMQKIGNNVMMTRQEKVKYFTAKWRNIKKQK